MGRAQSIHLPKHQSVVISDKSLWESIRILSAYHELNIYEMVEIVARFFLQSPELDKLIAFYKIQKEVLNGR